MEDLDRQELEVLERTATMLRQAVLLTWSDDEEERLAETLEMVEQRRDTLRALET